MKKIIIFLVLLLSAQNVFAKTIDYRDLSSYPAGSENRPLNFGGFLTVYFNSIAEYESIPESYQYIHLNFRNVQEDTPLYKALQKGVYMGFFKNLPIDLKTTELATPGQFARALESNLGQAMDETGTGTLTLKTVLDTLNRLYQEPSTDYVDDTGSITGNIDIGTFYPVTAISNFAILNDVYEKLKYNFYDSAKLRDEALIQGAAKGMADASGDKHTAYFPPVESKDFQDELSGEFEGIGAYIDMPKPGELHIISPMSGTPAEKSGLKGGDIITMIDGIAVTESTTLQDAINKIKGPDGTTVKLHVKRGTEELDFTITRAKIVIQYVEYKKLDTGDQYIKITTFGAGVKDAFVQALGAIAKDPSNGKLIIDLRNNPGGSLDEVAAMLNYFVPKGQSVVHIKYKNTVSEMESEGQDLIDLTRRKVVILINGGSASASEIMTGTIKDYLGENVRIVGEKSYGKGSVQSLDTYTDGSSFKYTIAKWFTGRTQTGIDGVGIKPDIEVKFDETLWKNGRDNQMEYAKNLSW
ncbi:MAG: S41 family peptidase [Candidatus Gracilibacteria bacterium]|nr:S41 family peptidase [Candidatus Gracilibacteria bacterium]